MLLGNRSSNTNKALFYSKTINRALPAIFRKHLFDKTTCTFYRAGLNGHTCTIFKGGLENADDMIDNFHRA